MKIRYRNPLITNTLSPRVSLLRSIDSLRLTPPLCGSPPCGAVGSEPRSVPDCKDSTSPSGAARSGNVARVRRIGVLASGSGTILDAIVDAGLPIGVVVVDRPCRAIDVADRAG